MPEGGPAAAIEPAIPHPIMSESTRRRGMFFLCLAVAGVGFTMSLQLGLNSNFLRDVLHFTGLQMGLVEAVRESCGVTAFLILALLAGMAEPVIGFIMLLIVAAGLVRIPSCPASPG